MTEGIKYDIIIVPNKKGNEKMKDYLYNVIAKYDNAEIIIRTNDLDTAIEEFFALVEDGVPVDVISGFTGEVFVSANRGENNWIVREWELMLLGWLVKNQYEEGIPIEEKPDFPPLVRDALIEFAKSIIE